MACVLPLLFLLILGSIELGRGVMVKHVLEEAARAGCRVAVVDSSTKEDVLRVVDEAMQAANLPDYRVTVSPDPPTNLGPFETVTVTVTVDCTDVSWVDAGYLGNSTLQGICIMPAESEGELLPDPTTGKKNKKNKKNKDNKKNKKDKKNKKAKKTEAKKNKKAKKI